MEHDTILSDEELWEVPNDGDIRNTLNVRETNYGPYADNAKVAQTIKKAMQTGRNWESLPDYMKESLELMATKIGRILNGNPHHKDTWHDVGGYSKLVEDELE